MFKIKEVPIFSKAPMKIEIFGKKGEWLIRGHNYIDRRLEGLDQLSAACDDRSQATLRALAYADILELKLEYLTGPGVNPLIAASRNRKVIK